MRVDGRAYLHSLFGIPQPCISQLRWHMSVIPALRRLRQEDEKVKVILGDIVSNEASLGYMITRDEVVLFQVEGC